MKRSLLLLLALAVLSLPLAAQAPRARDFRGVADSLQQRMLRRTGVKSNFKLDKVVSRGKVIDFYFSQNASAFPFRTGDDRWFTDQLKELTQDKMKGYELGHIYTGKQELEDLPMPALGNDGKALPSAFRVPDPRKQGAPLVQGKDVWPRGLSGRHIALWQSHGYYWEQENDRWEWQRSPNNRTVEDIYTQSYVLPFLMPMLENAGAVVICPRERDPQPYEVVCDNDDAFPGERKGFLRRKGHYLENGRWSSAGTGFSDAREVYRNRENPFAMGTARQTETVTDGDPKAVVQWRPDIPEKGDYAVYVSYKTLKNSTDDARYFVHHLGGSTLLHVNQRMGGGTWVYLGTFPFDKGTEGYVELTNRSSSAGVITADAVRFGGGMGKVERGGETSGMPAFVEGAVYNMQYGGVDLGILDDWSDEYTKDYAGRGKWVQLMTGGSRVNPDADGKRIPVDLSLAWHSDAGTTPNDSIIGTLVIYTRTAAGKDILPNGESRMNGRLLCDLVQTQLMEDIRTQFEPQWTRRQLWDRSYSESRTTAVPAMLLELLSHLNFADMRYGLDPSFRFTASRSVYKGILKYLSARYGCPYTVQPLPVHAFQAVLKDGKAVLSWEPTEDPLEPTAAPAYYRVYTRMDDGGFDAGYDVDTNTCTIPLEEGHLYSFKITACNQGGESFPSEILAAGLPSSSARKVLVVNNFTRVSAPSWFDTPEYAGFTDELDSGVPWGQDLLYAGSVNQYRRSSEWTDDDNPGFAGSYLEHCGERIAGNTFDFTAQHGAAILKAGFAVESSSAEAFHGVSDAFALDLVCGKQITTRVGRGAVPDRYTVFTDSLQTALRRFTAAGGNVLLSGSYIGTDAWDTIYPGVARASDNTRAFVKEVLGYQFLTNFPDRSGTVLPSRGSGMPAATYNRDWSSRIYRVENPDGIRPADKNGTTLMYYKGSRIPAATWYQAPSGYRVAAFGFPLETSAQLEELLKTVLGRF